MLTSLTLAYLSGGGKGMNSVVSDVQVPVEQPTETDGATTGDSGSKSDSE